MPDATRPERETARWIRQAWPHEAEIGLILGTGAGAVAAAFEPTCQLGYADLPHMVPATAVGHPGRFLGGRLRAKPVAIFEGRVHLYEGYSPTQVQFPVRVLAELGVRTLIVTNASGGLNPSYRCGDVVVIDDLIDLTGNRRATAGNRRATTGNSRATHSAILPLLVDAVPSVLPLPLDAVPSVLPLPLDGGGGRGVGVTRTLAAPFSAKLIEATCTTARRSGIIAYRGTYICVLGPNYETRAEYRFLRRIGDVVGMSTVHEVRAARSLGMRVLGLSVVSNECCPDQLTKTTGESVVRAVEAAADRLTELITGVCSEL